MGLCSSSRRGGSRPVLCSAGRVQVPFSLSNPRIHATTPGTPVKAPLVSSGVTLRRFHAGPGPVPGRRGHASAPRIAAKLSITVTGPAGSSRAAPDRGLNRRGQPQRDHRTGPGVAPGLPSRCDQPAVRRPEPSRPLDDQPTGRLVPRVSAQAPIARAVVPGLHRPPCPF